MAQPTGIINEKRLLAGAGEFYVGNNPWSLVRLGAYRDANVESKRESSELVFDNDTVNKFKKGRQFSFTFKLAELDPNTLASINQGWITKTTTAGTLVSGATQAITGATASSIIELEGQNHDLAKVVVTGVVGSVDWALTAGTNFDVILGPGGKSNIFFKSGGTVTTFNQTFTVTYSYTPSASTKFTFTETGIATKFYARFIHERPDGKQVIINLEDVQNLLGLTIDFVGNEDDDVATVDIELNGKVMTEWFIYED